MYLSVLFFLHHFLFDFSYININITAIQTWWIFITGALKQAITPRESWQLII